MILIVDVTSRFNMQITVNGHTVNYSISSSATSEQSQDDKDRVRRIYEAIQLKKEMLKLLPEKYDLR